MPRLPCPHCEVPIALPELDEVRAAIAAGRTPRCGKCRKPIYVDAQDNLTATAPAPAKPAVDPAVERMCRFLDSERLGFGHLLALLKLLGEWAKRTSPSEFAGRCGWTAELIRKGMMEAADEGPLNAWPADVAADAAPALARTAAVARSAWSMVQRLNARRGQVAAGLRFDHLLDAGRGAYYWKLLIDEVADEEKRRVQAAVAPPPPAAPRAPVAPATNGATGSAPAATAAAPPPA
ncbi:MAG: hypothetical protein HZA54_02260, partial [Planctomycetes bacterium]|nr:hypothetical protein [Planctomycetota bacterium]